ncbi:Tn3 family transposase [Candidatus Tisiphia endosymbiont of Ceraclea dissimilis]|uniref:Tn3 family transposase n=1 Tax=Candidatus Tisiphia endosymbiont of Ceraclea dissimilis TaxID=3077928 RepID=UPI003CCB22AA
MARLKILSNDDFDKLYKIPKLNDEERQFVFELDEVDKNHLNTISNIPGKINYILHLVYFRVSQYFFSFTFHGVKEDVRFIIKTYFSGSTFPTKQISNRQYYANRQDILNKHEMILYSKNFKSSMFDYLKSLVKQHSVPRYLFDSLLDYCHQYKVVRPAYSTLQDLISDAWNAEKLRISNKLYTIMDNSLRKSLSILLKKNDLFYQLTLIKKDQKDFTTNEIRASVEKNKLLIEIYHRSIEIIKQLGISEQNVVHYAELAEQYTIYGLRNLKQPNLARLYLLCYVHYRFLKINDHLASSFIHRVNCYIDDADAYQKEAIYQAQMKDKKNRDLAANILSFHINKKVPDSELRNKSFVIVPKNKFQQFIQKIRKPHLNPDYYRWEYYKNNAHAIKQNTRLIFKVLDFQTESESLSKAILFLKDHFDSSKSFSNYKFEDIPLEFIPSLLKSYVIEKVKPKKGIKKIRYINADSYEFMLYSIIGKYLAKGIVTIKDSLSYKSLDDELLEREYWNKSKKSIIKSIESQLISISIEQILNQLESSLNERYHEVNQRISSGTNNKIKIKYSKKGELVNWRLPYKKAEDSINNPFYDSMDIAAISQIISFTNHHTGFIKKFTHVLPTYSKNQPGESAIAACLVAKATGNDIYRMKDISDIKEQDLLSTYNNFIRYKTLISSSDVVLNRVEKLPIFEKYTLADYGIHGSVDGQKLETRYNTIKARYSSKYYGLGKGVSAYTLFANCLPLCTKIIGSNEHESHYLLDSLKSNTSNIRISAVSGDMHSINRINFVLLYMFGYRFMPRFTKLDQKARNNLVSFDDIGKYKKYIIKPCKQANKNLIIKETDNILRILATLALKENTQSNIVRKLSSYKSNDTLKALIELDKIIMSLYILDYVDDEEMRKCVHRSLNRGESYHQLRSAISKVSGKKLIGKTEAELVINNECARLLAICIIFYNAYLLSEIYAHCKNKGMTEECKKVIRLSPVAWQHISLVGKYEFTTNVELPKLDTIMAQLISNLNQVVVIIDSKKSLSNKVV